MTEGGVRELAPGGDLERAFALYEFLAAGGPDERLAYYVYPGDPVSKRRVRWGRGAPYPAPGQTAAEKTLGWALKAAAKEPFRGNVAIGCIFFRRTQQPVDVDNLLKHVLDSARNALWLDDRQVTAVAGVMEYDPPRPRTVIVVGRHESTLIRDTTVTGVCGFCGKPFEHPSWRTRKQRFCSPGCNARARGFDLRAPVPCRQCMTPFRRVNAYHVLCSEACRRTWLTGRNRGTGQWNKCADCGVEMPNHRARRCRQCWLRVSKRTDPAAFPGLRVTITPDA